MKHLSIRTKENRRAAIADTAVLLLIAAFSAYAALAATTS